MAYALNIQSISKTFGQQVVLNTVTMGVNSGEHVGLVGANGVGKSTLLQIVAGQLDADAGTIQTGSTGQSVGYFGQTRTAAPAVSIDAWLSSAVTTLTQLEAEMDAQTAVMTYATGAELDAALSQYSAAAERYERAGGYDVAHRLDAMLAGLGVASIDRTRPFASLSGGEAARFALAALLLSAPDVLILDEPSNHLDVTTLTWLETYLAGYDGATLIASHDRRFLDATVTRIVELDEHTRTAHSYAGGYSAYAAAKRAERARWEAAYAAQQEEIRALTFKIKVGAHENSGYRTHRDNDKFVRNIKTETHAGTVARRIHAAEEKLSHILADPIPHPPVPLRFSAQFDARTAQPHLLTASHLVKVYYGRRVIDDVSLTVRLHSRIVLVGENGAGKSTLLRLLAGRLAPDAGDVQRSAQTRIGWLPQTDEPIDAKSTVFEAFRAGLPDPDQALKALLLTYGLFRYDELDQPVATLSAGQRRKLWLARLIAGRANLLLLDEPTHYLSLDVLESLEAALADFPCPVLAASHDRRFIERFGGDVLELREGRLVYHADGYAGYLSAAQGVVSAQV